MNKLGTVLLAAFIPMAITVTPAFAQHGSQGGGMMGTGGQGKGMMQGGMMGKGGQGKGQEKGMMQDGMMGRVKGNCAKKMGAGMMGKGMMHSRPMMEARLAYIKADLEIPDAQMDAWNDYADAFRKRHDTMVGVRADMMKAKQSGNALERLDARINATQARLESLKALKPGTEKLYSVLTDEQKKKADELLGDACHMM